MTNTPAWHAEAKKLAEQGFTLSGIAKKLGRPRSSVRWAVDAIQERQKHRERVSIQRKATYGAGVRHRVMKPREPEPEPVLEVQVSRKPTLPRISMPDLDAAEPRVLRFAPKTRLTSSPGAERIRQIHLRMIREGRIREPGLPEQLHH